MSDPVNTGRVVCNAPRTLRRTQEMLYDVDVFIRTTPDIVYGAQSLQFMNIAIALSATIMAFLILVFIVRKRTRVSKKRIMSISVVNPSMESVNWKEENRATYTPIKIRRNEWTPIDSGNRQLN